MSDRVGIVLSLVAIVIIAIIVAKNYNFASDDIQFAEGEFYVAGTLSDRQTSEKQLLAQMNGVKSVACPQTALEQTEGGICRIGVYNQETNKMWSNECFFVSNKDLGENYSLLNPTENLWDADSSTSRCAVSLLHLDAPSADVKGVSFGTLFTAGSNGKAQPFQDDEYCPIISPFQFVFGNMNTTSRHEMEGSGSSPVVVEEIVIVSRDGKCRITFDNVVNWFCAGPVGTQGDAISTEWDDVDKTYKKIYKGWTEHSSGKNVHYSLIGNSGNAVVTGGGSGYIIGYAKEDTTVKIEYLNGTRWEEITVHQWITGKP